MRRSILGSFLASLLAACAPAAAATFAVTSTASSGAGTLREAIELANAATGDDVISFALVGSAPFRIDLTAALPEVTDTVSIDGATQSGWAGVPLIELRDGGIGAAADGLRLVGSGHSQSLVRGLAIGGFTGHGIVLTGAGRHVVEACRIGTNAAGTTAVPNGSGGIRIFNSPRNVIGGVASAAGNLISGNAGPGILLEGNLFESTGNRIEGNRIGTDATGLQALPNGDFGIRFVQSGSSSIGALTPESRNLISGNTGGGVFLGAEFGSEVLGNWIGVDSTGAAALPNVGPGVHVSRLSGVLIDNVISGNAQHGVLISDPNTPPRGAELEGNLIGTDAAGGAVIPNGGDGVRLVDANSTSIGGTEAVAANVISGNTGNGVTIFGASSGENSVLGNYIGTNADGADLGNGGDGVLIDGAGRQFVGEREAGAGNTIAFNAGVGVSVFSGAAKAVRANRIHSNGNLGIDLAPMGVTPNDEQDGDQGVNSLQNFPVLTYAYTSGTEVTVGGEMRSLSSANFGLDFFASPACDASGHGEAALYLGSGSAATNGSGFALFQFSFPAAVAVGAAVTASATDGLGNTSELSECIEATEPPPPLSLPAWACGLALLGLGSARAARVRSRHSQARRRSRSS